MRDYHPDDYERRENPYHDAPQYASDLLAWSASLDAGRLTFEQWQDLREETYAELLASKP